MAKSKKKAPKKSAVKSKKSPAKKSTPKKSQPKLKAKSTSAKAAIAPKATAPKSPAVKLNFKSLNPLGDRLVVKVEAQAEKTAGGIFIPTSVEDRPDRGTVMASGTGRRNKKGQIRPLDVEVGDTVLFAHYAGSKIEIAGQEFLILKEEEVLGIVT